jgi:hypothetical protein
LPAAQVLRFLCGIAVIGTIAVVYSLLFARLELKLYQGFAALLLASALTSSLVVGHPGKWDTLIGTSGAPYWFLPMVGFAWSLIWCFRHGTQQWIQVLSAGLLFFMCIGIVRDWRYRPYDDLKFADYAKALENARVGTLVSIPVNPVGGSDDWTIRLKKRECEAPCAASHFWFGERPFREAAS